MNIEAELVALIKSRDEFNESDLADEFIRKMSEAYPTEWSAYIHDAAKQLVLGRIRSIRARLRGQLRRHHIRRVAKNRADAKVDPVQAEMDSASIVDMHYGTGNGWSRRLLKMTKKQVLEQADHMRDIKVGLEEVERVMRAIAKRLKRDNQRVEQVYTREQLAAMFEPPEAAAS